MRYRAPPFKLTFSPFFFRVGLCSHTVLMGRRRGRTPRRRMQSDVGDRVDPSPRDWQSGTCVKATLSGRDRRTHRSPCGVTRSMDLHQRECHAIAIGRPRWRPILFSSWRRMERQISITRTITIDGLPGDSSGWSDPHRTDNDRASTRHWSVKSGPPNLPDQIGRQRLKGNHYRGSRSRFDRGPIATWLWPDRPTIGANSPPNRGWFVVRLKPRSTPSETASTTPSIRSHDRIKRPKFSGQNPL